MKIKHHNRVFKRWRGVSFRCLVLCLIVVGGWCSAYAQRYPVYVTPALMPPYSLKLSDYSAVGSQQLVVNIMVNDATISNLPVKLHIKIEGSAGVAMETVPTLTTPPIYLNGGQATLLFGADLADYFNPDNLVFTGYSKEQYRRTGYLPEGFYKFTVEILHYGTNRLISNRGLATAWMALGKPPVLRLPDDGVELGQVVGMPLTFSWLPSNVGVPSASVHYTFELWELRIPGINPNVITASMPAFHTVQQAHTALVVQPAELFLEQGMRYAWRVTASDLMGRVSFEQDGHSEVRTFTYQARCDTVEHFVVERQAARGMFRWDAGVNHTSFNVELRNPATAYFRQGQTFDNKVEYQNLDFGTTYQLRVQAVCNGDPQHVSAYSAWHTLTIPELKMDTTLCPDCRCAESSSPPPVTNLTLRKDLQPGDIISNAAGSTRFILKTVVPQADGVYKGLFWFWAEIWNLKILCEYWDLSVNTDNVVVKMDYESVYNPQFLLDAEAAKEYVDSLTNAINDLTVNTAVKDTLKLDIPIESIYIDADSNIVAVTMNPDGSITETVLEPDGDINNMVIQDADGNVYVVNPDGTVTGAENTGGNSSENVAEMKMTGSNDEPVDTVKAAQKVKELVTVLQERIIDYLKNSTDKYQKLAFENEKVLPSISQFDPTLGAGGTYKNGKLYVGTRNFKENSTDEDILSTIYHEYMHYLNWRFGDRYRMADLEKGIVYSITVSCFEERLQTENEFLEDVYLQFYTDKINNPKAEIYLDYHDFYNELDNAQKKEVDNYIKEKDLKPKVKCIPYDYSPSNYFKDEINAHTGTLKTNNMGSFKMSDEKISIYYSEINRYTGLYNKAKIYEINNNINSDGYEK